MSDATPVDRADSTIPGDLSVADDIQTLPAGLVRLSDPLVQATPRVGPPTVARLLAYRGRLVLLHAREKVGKSTLLRAAVAAATNGNPFLEQPTIGGRVLWVGEEAVGDVKGQLVEAGANLERLFFIRELNPSRKHEASLPKLVALLRPVWVIIDTWQHYLHVNRVTDTAGPGEQGLLLGDVANLAQQYDVAITVSHHNMKNRPEYRDSTVLGAIADMIVPFDRGDAPLVRRLRPSGRWHLAPVDIRWTRGVGYEVVDDAEGAEPSGRRSSAESVSDRLLLHLLDLDPDARPSARVLASALSCQGRRYNELKAAVERLVGEGSIDHARRLGSASSRDGGFALTPEGRLRAEALRENFNSGLATNEKGAQQRPTSTAVSEPATQGVAGNGNATASAEVEDRTGGARESMQPRGRGRGEGARLSAPAPRPDSDHRSAGPQPQSPDALANRAGGGAHPFG